MASLYQRGTDALPSRLAISALCLTRGQLISAGRPAPREGEVSCLTRTVVRESEGDRLLTRRSFLDRCPHITGRHCSAIPSRNRNVELQPGNSFGRPV